jgi:hypothetical protein
MIDITGTTNFDGQYRIYWKSTTTFEIPFTWVAAGADVTGTVSVYVESNVHAWAVVNSLVQANSLDDPDASTLSFVGNVYDAAGSLEGSVQLDVEDSMEELAARFVGNTGKISGLVSTLGESTGQMGRLDLVDNHIEGFDGPEYCAYWDGGYDTAVARGAGINMTGSFDRCGGWFLTSANSVHGVIDATRILANDERAPFQVSAGGTFDLAVYIGDEGPGDDWPKRIVIDWQLAHTSQNPEYVRFYAQDGRQCTMMGASSTYPLVDAVDRTLGSDLSGREWIIDSRQIIGGVGECSRATPFSASILSQWAVDQYAEGRVTFAETWIDIYEGLLWPSSGSANSNVFDELSSRLDHNKYTQSGSPHTLEKYEAYGGVISNQGATGSVQINLPVLQAGMHIWIYTANAQTLIVNPTDSNKINVLTDAPGDSITNDDVIGTYVHLVVAGGGWSPMGSAGVWTDTN